MVAARTVHTVATELHLGMLSLAAVTLLLRLALAWWSGAKDDPSGRWHRLGQALDATTHIAAIGGLIAMPLVIATGLRSAPGGSLDSTLLWNKAWLSGFAFGLWAMYLWGRWKYGARVWEHRGFSLLHAGTGFLAMQVTVMTASIGGMLAKGESLLDLAPWHPPFDEAIVLSRTAAMGLFVVAVAVWLIVAFVQPGVPKAVAPADEAW